MGRHGKRIEQHLQDGTYRPGRHSKPAPYANGSPVPPRRMKPEGKRLWALFTSHVPAEVQSQLDEPALTMLVSAWTNWQKFQSLLEAETDSELAIKLHRAARSAGEVFSSLAERFGFSPNDRRKMKLPKIEPEEINPFEALRESLKAHKEQKQ